MLQIICYFELANSIEQGFTVPMHDQIAASGLETYYSAHFVNKSSNFYHISAVNVALRSCGFHGTPLH